jgi:hypothetical protein
VYYVHIAWPCISFQAVDGYSRKFGYSATRDCPIIELLSFPNTSNTFVLKKFLPVYTGKVGKGAESTVCCM